MVTDQTGIRAMQRLSQRLWSQTSNWHIGDLAWGRNQHIGREPEWPTAYWEVDDEIVAWAWVRLPGHLQVCVDPAVADLTPEVLAWFESVATSDKLSAEALASETYLTEAYEAAGYRPDVGDSSVLHWHARDLVDLADPTTPEGFTLRHVRGAADIEQRVEAHRSAFAPSRVTVASYANVMAAWPYTSALDWVVEAPDGRFAAFCLIWYDEANRCGELEPVGTHADFRRRGLARAACLSALHALREMGAESAVVASVETPEGGGATALYRGLGFADMSRTVNYRKQI